MKVLCKDSQERKFKSYSKHLTQCQHCNELINKRVIENHTCKARLKELSK